MGPLSVCSRSSRRWSPARRARPLPASACCTPTCTGKVEGDRVTGIYDFGDSRVGDPAYEHTTLVCFLTPRQPAQLRAYLEGARLDPDDPGLGDSLIAWTALHRYGNLAWMARAMWGETPVEDLAALRAAITPGLAPR